MGKKIIVSGSDFSLFPIQDKESISLLGRNISTMGSSAFSDLSNRYITIFESENEFLVGKVIAGVKLKLTNTSYSFNVALLKFNDLNPRTTSGTTPIQFKIMETISPNATGVQTFMFKKPILIPDIHTRIGIQRRGNIVFDASAQYSTLMITPSNNMWEVSANIGLPCMDFVGYEP